MMQGRLVPPEPGRFQAFPRERWADEFELAKKVPVSYIEWIYDLYGADVNPLTNDSRSLQLISQRTGVAMPSACLDYFMDRPFLRCSEAEYFERQTLLQRLLRVAKPIGIRHVVLPFVDASRIEGEEDLQTVVRVVQDALPTAKETGIELHLETALEPGPFANLLDRIPESLVKVNYDSGNSSSLGFVVEQELAAYGSRIGSVHIKDRLVGGGTVPLGTGDAEFPALFRGLEAIGYRGNMTLQVARGEAGREVEWARHNRAFVARYWSLG
jgi:hexulose-6-phosphate isomerase